MTEALRIHYCLDKPRDDRRCRARCGHWVPSNQYTDEPEGVTCKACRKLLALPPHSSKPTAMTKLSSILPFALILLAACGPLPADDFDGSTSSGSTSGESTGSTGSESTGEGSTSGAMDASSTGEGSTSGLTGGGASSSSGGEDSTGGSTGSTSEAPWMGGSCFAEECDDAAQPCRMGLTCMEDPLHLGVKVCVADCVDTCVIDVPFSCGEIVPQAECRIDIAGGLRCFPVVCTGADDCAGECVDGLCY